MELPNTSYFMKWAVVQQAEIAIKSSRTLNSQLGWIPGFFILAHISRCNFYCQGWQKMADKKLLVLAQSNDGKLIRISHDQMIGSMTLFPREMLSRLVVGDLELVKYYIFMYEGSQLCHQNVCTLWWCQPKDSALWKIKDPIQSRLSQGDDNFCTQWIFCFELFFLAKRVRPKCQDRPAKKCPKRRWWWQK